MAIVPFAREARVGVPCTLVTRTSIEGSFTPFIGTGSGPNPTPGGYNPSSATAATNWQAAFEKVRELNDSSRRADLVVSVTDGDPNTINGPGTGTTTFFSSGSPLDGIVAAMTPPWGAANLVNFRDHACSRSALATPPTG